MELDSFLASPRWEILQIISSVPSSPIEIAEKLGTTVSYISQQLKLLEAANLVKKERTGAVEKGKPRTIFSLSKEVVYLIPLDNSFNSKKLISLTEYHRAILKIWFLENPELHLPLNRLYITLLPFLDKTSFFGVDLSKFPPKVLLVSEEKSLKTKGFLEEIYSNISYLDEAHLLKQDFSKIYPIHGSKLILNRMKELKGGNN